MKRLTDLSATQVIAIDATSVVIMASTFLALSAAHLNRGHGTPGFWLRATLSLLPLVLGGVISFWAHRQLENGIAAARWPDEEIASLRGGFETVLCHGFYMALLLASCIAMFASRHHHDFGWFLLTLGQGLARISYAFRVKPTQPPPTDDWRNRPRIQSEHWGQY